MQKPTKRELRAQFNTFNALHFFGALPAELPVHWIWADYYGEWCDPAHVQNPARYPFGIVFLSSKKQPACGWQGMLLHELIHAYLHFTHRDPQFDDYLSDAHDEAFAKECNRIGKKLGLEEVSVGECWSWPWTAHDADDLEEMHE